MTGTTHFRRSVLLCVLLWAWGIASPAIAADEPAVVVQFSTGTTRQGTLNVDAKLFINRFYLISELPEELKGLQYARRSFSVKAICKIDMPAGATLYAMTNNSDALKVALKDNGWTALTEPAAYKIKGDKRSELAAYKKTCSVAEHWEVPVGTGNLFIVASNLKSLPSPTTQPTGEPAEPESNDETSSTAAGDAAATQPALKQATIRALEIYRTDSGIMLGQTSEATLTVTPAKASKVLAMKFATKVGPEMELAKDEMLRYLRLKYPDWYAQPAELTFEDKYVNHDGGSIGTALGVLMLSAIEGFPIDPNLAITGDISANGKVRAIGGVAAKLKGAIASKCRVVALPMDNYDQLVDAVIYNGPSIVLDTQVIGIDTLPSAVDLVRNDRSPELTDTIARFAKIQELTKAKPGYLKTKAARDALEAVEKALPQHYSAKILRQYSSNKLPPTLSVTASRYYTTLAAQPVLDLFLQRGKTKNTQAVPSAAVKAGIADLKKLRPMANESVRPLIDCWVRFIDAVAARQERGGPQETVERTRQALLDEMARESADADMLQKTLKEGI